MKIIKYFAVIIILYACNTADKNNTANTTATDTRIDYRVDTVYIERNADITPANAYSDLFLDSSAVNDYIHVNNLTGEDEKRFRSFYNYRNLQYAWFTTQGFTVQAKGFWNLQDKLGTKADKSLRNRMDTLLNMDTLTITRFDTTLFKTELALTKAYLDFYNANRDKTQFANISPEKAIPVRKLNTLVLADTILQQHPDSSHTSSTTQFQLLKKQLQRYIEISKNGGWIPISNARLIKKGSSSPVIAIIKKRLQLTGDMTGTDTTSVYNDSLVAVIKNYQLHNGMKPTGMLTDTIIRSLNVPVERRIQQIIINLTRAQWMPATEDANYMSVNIPDFLLTVFENKAKAFDMPVAVGKEGTNTTMFTGDMNQVVFSPYWNIPVSIVERDILPKINADPGYLKSRHMEMVGNNTVHPTIRQLPGADNALGKVKFLFPNRYDIYFHDTNTKDIFNKDKRAVSHGCIRLADAEKLAVYLLRNDNGWSPEKVHTAMNAGKEQYVKISPAMPVVITYFTTWVDETGMVNNREDLYGNDSKIAQMLFENMPLNNMPVVKDSVIKH